MVFFSRVVDNFINEISNSDVLGTIDYLDKSDGTVIFRTCAREKSHVIVQLGTCDPSRALKVAKMM